MTLLLAAGYQEQRAKRALRGRLQWLMPLEGATLAPIIADGSVAEKDSPCSLLQGIHKLKDLRTYTINLSEGLKVEGLRQCQIFSNLSAGEARELASHATAVAFTLMLVPGSTDPASLSVDHGPVLSVHSRLRR